MDIRDKITELIIQDLKEFMGGSDDWELVWVYRDKFFLSGLYDRLFQDFIHRKL